jgi:ribosomal protein S18 acetylase RimI-like enzyme
MYYRLMIPFQDLSGIQYGVAEPSDMDEIARLLSVVFTQDDPLAVTLGVTPAEFEDLVRLFCPRAAADRLTVVARSAPVGEMVGALLTAERSLDLPSGLERMSEKFAPVFDLLGQLDADYQQGKSMPPGHCLYLVWLGVARPFAGRGIGQQLVASCLENGARRAYRSAVTEATSSASQHIFRKHGFVEQVRRSYQDFRYQGEAVFASIGGHAGAILMDKDLA